MPSLAKQEDLAGIVEGSPPTDRGATRLAHWIDGASEQPTSGEFTPRHSPVDHRVVTHVAAGDATDVERAVAASLRAATVWGSTSPSVRGRILSAVAAAVRSHAAELSAWESAETGKSSAVAAREIEGAAAYFEYYGSLVSLPAGDLLDLGPAFHVYTRYEPIGVVGVITPWNMPLNQAARACAPALAAGNAVVAKPSEFTSATTVRLAELCSESGLPDGVFNVVLGSADGVGDALVRHP